MPARHFRSSRAPVRRQRRALVWATLDQGVTIAAGAVSHINILALLSVAGSSLVGVTIMRTHCRIAVTSTVTAGDQLRVGFIVGTTQAVGTTANTFDPANPELDWILWRNETAAPTFAEGGSNILVYDIRAKRKMQELNQAYLLSLQNSAGISKTMQVQGRVLLALP